MQATHAFSAVRDLPFLATRSYAAGMDATAFVLDLGSVQLDCVAAREVGCVCLDSSGEPLKMRELWDLLVSTETDRLLPTEEEEQGPLLAAVWLGTLAAIAIQEQRAGQTFDLPRGEWR